MKGWLRPLGIALGAAGAVWGTTGITLALTLGRLQPATALAMVPDNGVALAVRSRQLVERSDYKGAAAMARAALAREPLNVEAARTLGLALAQGEDLHRANRLFAYSESLSRRDLPTQLWLIETAVQRGDIAGALVHYDRAMRTSANSRTMLIPVLVQAALEPEVARQLAALLATRPVWGSAFMEALIDAKTTPPSALALILSRLEISPTGKYSWLLSAGLNRLVAEGAYGEAYMIYRAARRHARPSGQLLRDGTFAIEYPIQPFEWWVRDDPDLAGVVDNVGGRIRALSIIASDGRVDDVARQALVLRPGRYALGATVGNVPADERARPILSVKCMGGKTLVSVRIAGQAPSGRMRNPFDVPMTGCDAQWVSIASGPDASVDDAPPWVTALSVSPR